MKKYTGTKTISAEPMTRGMAVAHHLLRDDAAKMNPEDAGYHVVYDNGYHSWFPADVFEEAYKVAETWIDRAEIEFNELTNKKGKLSHFVMSEAFKSLNYDTRAALILQLHNMEQYEDKLGFRIAQAEDEHAEYPDEYSLIELPFGQAVELLRAGFSVRRSGWNGKGMYVVKQVPQVINENIIPKMNSLPEKAKELLLRGENKCISYRNQMLLVQPDGTADSWVPSSSDVFAEDWELVI